MSYDNINEARILGYLEVNPHICSGCGTPFQSKSVDSPGYLSKEKFNERRLVIQQIKAKQEAIKILTDAGIDINSSLAEEILKKADISKDTIEGVKRIGRKNDKRVVKSEDEVVDQQVEKELKLNIPLDGLEDDVKQLINDINNEANPKQPRQRLSIRKSVKSTTLDFLKIRLSNGVTVIDTPGLINEGQLTTLLTTNELKKVIPSKQINAITLRVEEGKTVLIGGIASITLLEGRPFYFTFFISNEIKLHPTDSTKAESFLEKHIGELIYPPDSLERLKELGPPTYHEFSIEGESWKKSTTDIVISGLGWITVTGPGIAKVKVGVPKQTSVSTRPALLPYEATYTTAKFTGGRLLKKSKKPGAAGSNSYGWRA
eukprot:gene19313-25175_t